MVKAVETPPADTMAHLENLARQLSVEALSLPPQERTAFLDSACQEIPQLRPLVEDLLHDQRHSVSAAKLQSLGAGVSLGRYTILEKLGAGGMGTVYRARDQKLERLVAIKVLSAGMLTGEDAHRHFRLEGLALAKLNHPNIAAVYDVGEQDGLSYIVMELVLGNSLAARLGTGALSLREATSIVVDVAEALEQAHEQGVIHRDLKPANLIVTPQGRAKVLDFGLAKLLAGADPAMTLAQTQGLLGTPLYMSPEQAMGKALDSRTDLWSLGALYYESLTQQPPFLADGTLAVLRAVTEQPLKPLSALRSDLPELAQKISSRALQKDPANRYQTARDMVLDARKLLGQIDGTTSAIPAKKRARSRWWWAAAAVAFVAALAIGGWLWHWTAQRRWAREQAFPQVDQLSRDRQPLAAYLLMKKAQAILPGDTRFRDFEQANTQQISVDSDPAGAQIEIQDYMTPAGSWYSLGTTPLAHIRIPQGYFRWRATKSEIGSVISAPETNSSMNFPLRAGQNSPPDMVYDPGGTWADYIAFIGWYGPYHLPPFDIDRYEVTNLKFQKFVDSGGYTKPQYWPASFELHGKSIPWSEAMQQFRDATGRPGPATWTGGHYTEGQGQYPVSGVSWFEASAYAAYAGKALPVVAQWYQAADPGQGEYTVPLSNMTGTALAAVGKFNGLGSDGTYDMAGNVREWVANAADDDVRFILGGSWNSQAYIYGDPEALTPYDRSPANGFRCVRNRAPIPEPAAMPIHHITRDFSAYKPVSDDVFRAYRVLYDYEKTPLHSKLEGVVNETSDWSEEKVSFDTAYNGERMSGYLFLPKRVRPPYQTVLFFPSATVMFLPPDSSHLGDTKFFDYVLQSGRAVFYPVYQDTYERRLKYNLPGGGQPVSLTAQWYQDAARSLDYLATRNDVDSHNLAYMGVSMGSADGVILVSLLQDRLKTAILLDGGYFLQPPPQGGDQADFVSRIKKPVLMVNGRYDYTFPVEASQDPLFRMLGTPPADKSHVILDTPHNVTEDRPRLVKTVLSWLDRYLGRVS